MDRIDPDDRTLNELCDDVIERYHVPLHRRLQHIREQLASVPGSERTTTVEHIRVAFSHLADQIESHLSKEEHLLFPALGALVTAEREHRPRPASPFVTVLHPIRMLEAEHLRIEESVRQLRELACELSEADSRAPAWQRCLASLGELESSLREHHREENERLFPMALDSERRLP
jgi:regulator of cell morphogenesis and NO signaling